MAPPSFTSSNRTLALSSSLDPATSETVTNIVFGLCALTVGGITIWQGIKARGLWMNYLTLRNIIVEGIHIIISTGLGLFCADTRFKSAPVESPLELSTMHSTSRTVLDAGQTTAMPGDTHHSPSSITSSNSNATSSP